MIVQANAYRIPLRSNSVHCVITSPPFWALRTYQTPPQLWGGDPNCDHDLVETQIPGGSGDGESRRRDRKAWRKRGERQPGTCRKCGGWIGELGLEENPDCFGWTRRVKPCGQCYICHILQVFREVRRVLRKEGTLWLNISDSFSGSGSGPGAETCTLSGGPPRSKTQEGVQYFNRSQAAPPGLKPKDLCMIPARVALALEYDGWYLRSEIIWHKPNCLPEAAQDRPSRDHESIFLFSKRRRPYFYDEEAIKEPASPETHARYARSRNPNLKITGEYVRSAKKWVQDILEGRAPGVNPKAAANEPGSRQNSSFSNSVKDIPENRKKRTVWTVPTEAYSGPHFATFPQRLIVPMILAGTSEQGCCPLCKAPLVRILEPIPEYARHLGKAYFGHDPKQDAFQGMLRRQKNNNFMSHGVALYRTVGWRRTCKCPSSDREPCLILDPFCGTATVGRVALIHNRKFVGLDLKREYLTELAQGRMTNLQPLLRGVSQ